MSDTLFWPGATVSAVATTTTQAVALGSARTTVRLVNVGSEVVYLSFGDSSITTTVSTGMPILPGTVELFTLAQLRPGSSSNPTHMAIITSANTSRISATTGEGET